VNTLVRVGMWLWGFSRSKRFSSFITCEVKIAPTPPLVESEQLTIGFVRRGRFWSRWGWRSAAWIRR